jgi:hypothetical protein
MRTAPNTSGEGWVEVGHDVYEEAFALFGGSVITNPSFVRTVSDILNLKIFYLASYDDAGHIVGAVPRWGSQSDGNIENYRSSLDGVKAFDFGQMEPILPLATSIMHRLPPGPFPLSWFHNGHVPKLKKCPVTRQMIFRCGEFGTLSRRFIRSHEKQLRRFRAAGGVVRDVHDISVEEFSSAYYELHKKRWGEAPYGLATLTELLTRLPEMRTGSILYLHGAPIAVQYLIMSECRHRISVEGVNGAYDPEQKQLSPGSVLHYLNTKRALEYATAVGKSLRYSFGRARVSEERNYKNRWCTAIPYGLYCES